MIRSFTRHLLPLRKLSSVSLTRGMRSNRTSHIGESASLQNEAQHERVFDIDDPCLSPKAERGSQNIGKSIIEQYLDEPISPSQPLTTENQHEHLACNLTPLHSLPYSKQVNIKWKQSVAVIDELEKLLRKAEPPLDPKESLRCDVYPVVCSPVTEAYRNKDEFRVHVGVDGNPKTVGFFVGRFADQSAKCVNVDRLIITKEEHKLVARHFEKFIRQSPLSAFEIFNDYSGYWRGITVRSNRRGEMMAIVTMHPQDLTKEQLDEQKAQILAYFKSLDDCKITSMYFQACRYKRCSSTEAPYEHLFGEKHIYEELNGLKFRISPGSFFQVNALAAEQLYTIVKDMCSVDENSIVMDVCSGTGTISLALAPHIFAAVGIETNPEAIEDANINAQLNNIKNVTFLQGKAEALLPGLIPSLNVKNVTVVLNPTRAGVATKVIGALRSCREIQKIVYISCHSTGAALHNFAGLCKPATKKMPGKRFTPTVAIPLDMFPHTILSELVVLFER